MLPLVLLAVTQSASTWQQGDVCTGTNGTSPRFMLTGKHLIVGFLVRVTCLSDVALLLGEESHRVMTSLRGAILRGDTM